MTKDHERELNEWWEVIGKEMKPLPHESPEEYAKRIAYRTYSACLENNDLD